MARHGTDDSIARQCLRGVRGALTDDQYVDALERIKAAMKRHDGTGDSDDDLAQAMLARHKGDL